MTTDTPEPLDAYELPGTILVVYDRDNYRAWLNTDTWVEAADNS